jgi:hypothetical protein
VRKRNIDWLDGMLFAVPRTKEVSEFMTLRRLNYLYTDNRIKFGEIVLLPKIKEASWNE